MWPVYSFEFEPPDLNHIINEKIIRFTYERSHTIIPKIPTSATTQMVISLISLAKH